MAFPLLMLFFPMALAAKVAQEPPTAADLGGTANAPVVCQTTTLKKEDFTTLRNFAEAQGVDVPDVKIPATAWLTLSAYVPAGGALVSLPTFAVDVLNPFGWATMLQMNGDGAGLKWTVNDKDVKHKISFRVLGDTNVDGQQFVNINTCKLTN